MMLSPLPRGSLFSFGYLKNVVKWFVLGNQQSFCFIKLAGLIDRYLNSQNDYMVCRLRTSLIHILIQLLMPYNKSYLNLPIVVSESTLFCHLLNYLMFDRAAGQHTCTHCAMGAMGITEKDFQRKNEQEKTQPEKCTIIVSHKEKNVVSEYITLILSVHVCNNVWVYSGIFVHIL